MGLFQDHLDKIKLLSNWRYVAEVNAQYFIQFPKMSFYQLFWKHSPVLLLVLNFFRPVQNIFRLVQNSLVCIKPILDISQKAKKKSYFGPKLFDPNEIILVLAQIYLDLQEDRASVVLTNFGEEEWLIIPKTGDSHRLS